MIDKLDVRVPRGTPFTKEFRSFYRDIWNEKEFRESKYYTATVDLRPYGYSMILSQGYKFRAGAHGAGANKVELIDTAEMSYSGMVNEIERVYECAVRTLQVM